MIEISCSAYFYRAYQIILEIQKKTFFKNRLFRAKILFKIHEGHLMDFDFGTSRIISKSFSDKVILPGAILALTFIVSTKNYRKCQIK